ncbi:MAG: formate dehydrogenase [Methylobacter sp.]|nr:MAG: formate dehydrogenase [Methylobacter sp.]PPD04227.1 MAG: formate dehydrogenase [Methylobacter sp.]PPD23164.1 MAG: formate dehydrogenase [Methylobacter sp.]
MNTDRLIQMANDIADFFDSETDKMLAVENVKNHLTKFWDPRMRKSIIAYCQTDGSELHALVRDAVKKLDSVN